MCESCEVYGTVSSKEGRKCIYFGLNLKDTFLQLNSTPIEWGMAGTFQWDEEEYPL